jgi:integrase
MAQRAGQIVSKGDRRWLVRWFIARDENGKRRYASKTIRGTKKDAQKYLNSVLRSRDLGVQVEPAKITLNSYLDKWLEASARPRVSARTLEDYKWNLKHYARPALGARRLDRIRPLDLQHWLSELEAQGLSGRTIRIAYWILASALKQAVRWEMLPSNPADRVDPPKQRRREMRALSPDEVERFRAAVEGTRFATLFDFLLATGCRPGEALALRWADLDLDTQSARIMRALSKANGRPVFKETKTGQGRALPLPTSLARALTAHRKTQAEQALKLGGSYARDLDLVFANEVGLPLDLRNITQRHFKPALQRAGLPAIVRLYDLRHTCATLMLASGENIKVVAERLGHASPAMTLDVYVHTVPGQQEAATRKLEELLFRDPK